APPRPQPPAPPAPLAALRSAPGGFELRVEAQEGVTVLLQRGPLAPLTPASARIDLPRDCRAARVFALRGARLSAPSAWLPCHWRSPPPAPEPPLVFARSGVVELAWMPPEGATWVRIERDAVLLAERPAEEGLYTDHPPPGRYLYRLRALSEQGISAPSAAARVRLRPPR
ncbi:hypothetical protein KJ940_22905, partial [Myxococcota bacterium]|nr:hypothetical protein [Myxococcota bacterium]